MMHRGNLRVHTQGRGTLEITGQVDAIVRDSGVQHGLCTIFIKHTSASLIVCENADPSVRRDLERYFGRLVRDGDSLFEHDSEGDDDMPAHIRAILTATSLSVPIADGRLDLGTWQGLFVWEHRTHPHTRHISITILGE